MKIKVPYFDDSEIEFSDGDYDPGDARPAAALNAFLALTSDNRLNDSRHVYAYYRDYREAVGGEDWMDAEMGMPEKPWDIWSFVYPSELGIWPGDDGDDNHYVYLEANCDWEEEHGLLLVWRNGAMLTRVSGFDGHPTNEDAGDGRQEIVYQAVDPRYTTRAGES
ncbi:DUF6985 domain-containing protein [Mesorhizobium loti]|uniref:DUF6985 domain-containing protein n=1 Tax=Mesorhizobium loti R88b TaxID=935548 RepID=A0A6M7WEE8_RHILI|nr:hypothetical protein [Mesorhizobium loti]QKD00325.1 hypothetical protein EB235_01605 [Mesorhizobium loti R88b]